MKLYTKLTDYRITFPETCDSIVLAKPYSLVTRFEIARNRVYNIEERTILTYLFGKRIFLIRRVYDTRTS